VKNIVGLNAIFGGLKSILFLWTKVCLFNLFIYIYISSLDFLYFQI